MQALFRHFNELLFTCSRVLKQFLEYVTTERPREGCNFHFYLFNTFEIGTIYLLSKTVRIYIEIQ